MPLVSPELEARFKNAHEARQTISRLIEQSAHDCAVLIRDGYSIWVVELELQKLARDIKSCRALYTNEGSAEE
jgi:hypothetical protein